MKRVEGYPDYSVDRAGFVYSHKYGKTTKLGLRLDKNGYHVVSLCMNGKAKNFRVHRLVAQAFIANPKSKPQVNHKDGQKLNNCAKNLEWVNNGENQKHAYLVLKRLPVGERRVRCIETGIVYNSGHGAERYLGIGHNCISMAISGRSKTAGGYHWELA